MTVIQDKNKLKVVLGASPVNVEESFPKGIIFKKVEQAYAYDREAKKSTNVKDGYQITATDVNTLEDITVKVPQGSEIPEGLESHVFKPISFLGMVGTRVDFKVYLKADQVFIDDYEN